MSENKSETTPTGVTRADLDNEVRWLSQRMERQYTEIENLRKTIKLLARILADKKVLSPELMKTFEETVPDTSKDLIEWYIKSKKGE